MHPFLPSFSDKEICARCKREPIAHTDKATCEACDTVTQCEIFGKPEDTSAMLLCASCTHKEEQANTRVLTSTQETIEHAREIDSSIRYNGDIFNAKTVAISSLRSVIMADESIGTPQERQFKFQEEVALRLEKLKKVIFKLDDKKHELITEQIALRESLRDFASSIRADIRERIKLSDANYQPHNIVKTPKISTPKASPFDKMVQIIMSQKGISEAEAKEQLMKGLK